MNVQHLLATLEGGGEGGRGLAAALRATRPFK